MGCAFTASKRRLPRLVGLLTGGSVRPLSPFPSVVAVLFAHLPESYLPPSREVLGVVIYRSRGHPLRDGPTPIWKDPYYYSERGAHVQGRARVPIGRGVAYVYSSTRVVRAVFYGYYARKVAHV